MGIFSTKDKMLYEFLSKYFVKRLWKENYHSDLYFVEKFKSSVQLSVESSGTYNNYSTVQK